MCARVSSVGSQKRCRLQLYGAARVRAAQVERRQTPPPTPAPTRDFLMMGQGGWLKCSFSYLKGKRKRKSGVVVGVGGCTQKGGKRALYTRGVFQRSADLKPLGESFDFNLALL